MATFNGTQVADLISGTDDDDIITGLAGNDTINGDDGADQIDAGAGDDNVLGGAGNDTVTIGATTDFTAAEILDGGDDDDILVGELADTDDLTQGTNTATIGGVISGAAGVVENFEYFQVSNANDFLIDLTSGEDQVFGLDLTITSQDFGASGAQDVLAGLYTGATNAIGLAAGDVTIDQAEGIVINGTSYEAGDTITTADGGTVTIAFNTDRWTLDYQAAPLSTIELGETIEDEVLSVQMTDNNGNVIEAQVTLESDIQAATALDLSSGGLDVDTGVRVVGDDAVNTVTTGEGNDTVVGQGGADVITIDAGDNGDNAVWAGANDDDADDLNIDGGGNNTVAGGAGADDIDVAGDGANLIFGGADGDNIAFNDAEGNNTAWGGSDDADDTFTVDADSDGDNTLGGGLGADNFTITGDGNNTIFAGADDDADVIAINGDGNNTVFGGQGEDGDGVNDIDIAGTGDNTIFNGNGNDTIDLAATATGDNVLFGGAGNDTFTFASADASGTVTFADGNGADTITGFEAADEDHKIDLSAFDFADADDVLDSITDGANSVLFITAGQTITFTGVTLAELQAADPDDWLIL